MQLALLLVAAYLLGSVPFAVVVSRLFGMADPRSYGSGNPGATNRFGQGLGKGAGSWSRGILSAPMTYWDPAPLVLTATGGQFLAGRVRVVLHWWELRIPN